ncbi:MAG: GntR family transcriptional regulator [Conexibacter sp.]|nr:GntR family transcriptional regulator [Conexibacter sp.]
MSTFDSLEPLAFETTPGIIADRIRASIIDGSLASGTQLGETQLAERLAVSRGPIREALQRLIQEGLLRAERHRGVFVVELGREDVDDIYLARHAVERTALSVVLDRADQEAIGRLAPIVDQMRQAVDGGRWAEIADLDLRFHEQLVQSSGSPRLARMFRTLLAETRMCLGALESEYPEWRDLVAEHVAIVEALRAGRAQDAYALLAQHFETARAGLAKTPDGTADSGARSSDEKLSTR